MAEAELLLDLEEIEKLESLVQRERLKKLIAVEKNKLQNEIKVLKKSTEVEVTSRSPPKVKTPTVKITSYAWDQSEKFVKIYLSNLNNVQNLESSNITLVSENQLHCLTVENLNGKKYVFQVPKLANPIKEITFKVKTNMILLMMKKTEQTTWKYLTEQEKIAKTEKEKIPDMDKNADPSTSIMSMMKKMYDDGDDDMKRTIAKAWTESREKSAF